MDLAILGTDTEILGLARAAVAQRHKIVWLGDVRPVDRSEIAQLAPGLTDNGADWELLLDGALATAVLVGHGTASGEMRAEQLKRLATVAVPLLVAHPVTDSVITYYELDMIRRETGGILRHFNPLAGHPILSELADSMATGSSVVGSIHQLTCERHLDESSRQNVLGYLARDAELIAILTGDIRRLSAIGPNATDTSYASLQVQMTTDGPASLRWSVGSRSMRGTTLEVTLVGERGVVALNAREVATADYPTWQLTTTTDGHTSAQHLDVYHAPQIAVEQLEAAVVDQAREHPAVAPTWDSATRAMEVVDAVTLSLEKGRTIDVFQQQLTERLAFRGMMAALGCGLLVVSFFVIVFVTLLGGAEGPAGQRLMPSWQFILLGVMSFFLLLQAVPLLASKSRKRRPG
jgi:hypothetical protein